MAMAYQEAIKTTPLGGVFVPVSPAVGPVREFPRPTVTLTEAEVKKLHEEYDQLIKRVAIHDPLLANILSQACPPEWKKLIESVVPRNLLGLITWLGEAVIIYMVSRAKEKLSIPGTTEAFGGFTPLDKHKLGVRLIEPVDLASYSDYDAGNVKYDWKITTDINGNALSANSWAALFRFYADVDASAGKYRTFAVFGLYAPLGSAQIDSLYIKIGSQEYVKTRQRSLIEPVRRDVVGEWLALPYMIVTDVDISLADYYIYCFIRSATLYVKPVGFVVADRTYLNKY